MIALFRHYVSNAKCNPCPVKASRAAATSVYPKISCCLLSLFRPDFVAHFRCRPFFSLRFCLNHLASLSGIICQSILKTCPVSLLASFHNIRFHALRSCFSIRSMAMCAQICDPGSFHNDAASPIDSLSIFLLGFEWNRQFGKIKQFFLAHALQLKLICHV